VPQCALPKRKTEMWQYSRRSALIALIEACASLSLLGTMTAALTPSAPPPAWGAFQYAWGSIARYSTTITVFEQKGAQVQNVVFEYTFHKPSSATVHVVRGPNAGVTLEWNGGDTVVAHRGSGLLAVFKKTFSLQDPLVTTIRGSSIDQLSFAAILSHGQNTPGTASQAPGPVIEGVPTQAVAIVPTSALANTGLTLEIVDLSSTTYMPARVLGYDGATLVRQVDFTNTKLNV
jgi:hypothetical protein